MKSPTSLLERLTYDRDTGEFRWIAKPAKNISSGSIAGSRDKNGYTVIVIDGRQFLAHRLAWVFIHGNPPTAEIDHINGDRSDNRAINLRNVTRKVNAQNLRRPSIRNKCGSLGVYRCLRSGKLRASITVSGRTVHLGLFETIDAAHTAYVDAKRRLHVGCTV